MQQSNGYGLDFVMQHIELIKNLEHAEAKSGYNFSSNAAKDTRHIRTENIKIYSSCLTA